MIVFGDRHRRRSLAEQIQILRDALALAQAVADVAFERHGCDRMDAAAELSGDACRRAATRAR